MGFLEESELRRESSSVPQSSALQLGTAQMEKGERFATKDACRPTVRGEEERVGTVSNIWRNCEKTESVLILLGA